ncbi:MAG: endonuclease/exonuclease/phosphatase family protein [Candidatus Hydrogenedentes bacterium]|nr:endonuclease/exonuclease/phosphatase family protein [Candidatus Hydrogenedentota bacterium]
MNENEQIKIEEPAETETATSPVRPKQVVAFVTYAYFAVMTVWLALFVAWRDGTWWLFLANSFSVYLFVPLPVAAAVAVWTRRRTLYACVIVWTVAWLVLFGRAYLRPIHRPDFDPDDPNILSVMTFNVRADNKKVGELVDLIRDSDADLVAIQELTPVTAAAIENGLADEYPYRLLEPWPHGNSSGTISRYPLRRSKLKAGGRWVTNPAVSVMDFNGHDVTVINVHFWSNAVGSWHNIMRMSRSVKQRELQTWTIREVAANHDQPLLVLGDLNATPMSRAYELLTGSLTDTWAEVGRGLGHTFPGDPRPMVMGIPVPRWLIRIDYVFHTAHWQAISARVLPYAEGSDHRPVTAILRLVNDS